MLEENKEKDFEEILDDQTALIPLNENEQDIINNIIEATDQKELQAQFDAFNINQSKKNALRIIKLNSLLDKVEDQAIERFNKRPDQISNKELLDYMQVVATQIDRSQKVIDTLKEKPMIKVANQKNEVNINIGNELDRDSKERVVDAIQALLKQVRTNDNSFTKVDIQEAEIVENTDFDQNEEKINVYSEDKSLLNDEGEI